MKQPSEKQQSDKQIRLSQALRANLLKRKTQQRTRQLDDAPSAPETVETQKETNSKLSLTVATSACLLALLFLTGCGRKNAPTPLEKDDFPRSYPAP